MTHFITHTHTVKYIIKPLRELIERLELIANLKLINQFNANLKFLSQLEQRIFIKLIVKL